MTDRPKSIRRHRLPAKPLPKLTGRPTGDLQLKMPSLPVTDILVRNLSPATLSRALASGMKVESRRDLGVLGYSLTRLIIPHDMKAEQAKALLQEVNPTAAVDLNQRYRLYPSAREGDGSKPSTTTEPARTTGGCGSDRCYGAATIGWQEQLAACAKGLSVGVIDTGIDSTHPSLAHQPERFKFGQFGPGFRGAGSDLHGTGVLALLAGNSRSSTPGLIPGAKFFVADIFFADENGLPVSTTLHLLEALEWMDRLRVQIINLSLSGPRDDLVQAAITRMSKLRTMDGVTKPAVIFVAAAGNGGPGAPPSYPAAYPETLAVTAVSRDLRGYRRANHGDYIDVAAPGVDIWTALPDGRQGYQTGTSFATPYMTAVVASLYRSLPGPQEQGSNTAAYFSSGSGISWAGPHLRTRSRTGADGMQRSIHPVVTGGGRQTARSADANFPHTKDCKPIRLPPTVPRREGPDPPVAGTTSAGGIRICPCGRLPDASIRSRRLRDFRDTSPKVTACPQPASRGE